MKLRIVYKDGSIAELEDCTGAVKISEYSKKVFVDYVLPLGVKKFTIPPSQFENIKSITVVLDY